MVKISILLMSYVVPVKSKMEISQKFVAFSEYINSKSQIKWAWNFVAFFVNLNFDTVSSKA